MNVGNRLKALRETKGLTVNKLANMAGISQSFLRDVELGNKNPTVETLHLFCDALGITLSDFFDEQSEISPILMTSLKKLNQEQQLKLAEFLNTIS